MISFSAEQRFVVTGASSGIGESVALLLNRLGATIIGVGRNRENLASMKSKAAFPENIFLEQTDLTQDIAGLPAYVKSLKEKYGKFQGLAYCAGITQNIPLKILDFNASRKLFDIDYFAPVYMAKGMADKRNNAGSGTSMVFISSAGAVCCARAMSDYSGAKAALCASVKAIARELAPYGIRANCILPSDIETPMTLADPDLLASKRDRYPMGFGRAEDVANMTAFLLSDKAKWITGQNYIIDCGSF